MPPPVAVGARAGDGGGEGLVEEHGEEVGGEGRDGRIVARQAREELRAEGFGCQGRGRGEKRPSGGS